MSPSINQMRSDKRMAGHLTNVPQTIPAIRDELTPCSCVFFCRLMCPFRSSKIDCWIRKQNPPCSLPNHKSPILKSKNDWGPELDPLNHHFGEVWPQDQTLQSLAKAIHLSSISPLVHHEESSSTNWPIDFLCWLEFEFPKCRTNQTWMAKTAYFSHL